MEECCGKAWTNEVEAEVLVAVAVVVASHSLVTELCGRVGVALADVGCFGLPVKLE